MNHISTISSISPGHLFGQLTRVTEIGKMNWKGKTQSDFGQVTWWSAKNIPMEMMLLP